MELSAIKILFINTLAKLSNSFNQAIINALLEECNTAYALLEIIASFIYVTYYFNYRLNLM